jgi:hypothetical protein
MSNFSHDRVPDGKEEWLTDPRIIHNLGRFDLDPCSPVTRPWNTAHTHYSIEEDGTIMPWKGRVWLNPPYGKKTGIFMELLKNHGNGIALVYARTETKFFFDHIWNDADALFFFQGRLLFYHVDGSPCTNKKTGSPEYAGAPSVLVAYGKKNAIALQKFPWDGKYIPLK